MLSCLSLDDLFGLSCSQRVSTQMEPVSQQRLWHKLLCFATSVVQPAEALDQPLSGLLYRDSLSIRVTIILSQEADIMKCAGITRLFRDYFS